MVTLISPPHGNSGISSCLRPAWRVLALLFKAPAAALPPFRRHASRWRLQKRNPEGLFRYLLTPGLGAVVGKRGRRTHPAPPQPNHTWREGKCAASPPHMTPTFLGFPRHLPGGKRVTCCHERPRAPLAPPRCSFDGPIHDEKDARARAVGAACAFVQGGGVQGARFPSRASLPWRRSCSCGLDGHAERSEPNGHRARTLGGVGGRGAPLRLLRGALIVIIIFASSSSALRLHEEGCAADGSLCQVASLSHSHCCPARLV